MWEWKAAWPQSHSPLSRALLCPPFPVVTSHRAGIFLRSWYLGRKGTNSQQIALMTPRVPSSLCVSFYHGDTEPQGWKGCHKSSMLLAVKSRVGAPNWVNTAAAQWRYLDNFSIYFVLSHLVLEQDLILNKCWMNGWILWTMALKWLLQTQKKVPPI